MPRSAAVLADFQNPVVGVAGYYSPDDNYQHVIVATKDNVVTEIWWRSNGDNSVHGQAELSRFGTPIVAIAGYYADVDKNQHVIVADQANTLTEIWWQPDPQKAVRGQAELTRFDSPIVAIAGYYSDSDKYEHVIVATADRMVTEVWWQPAKGVGRTELGRMDAPIVGVAGLDGRKAFIAGNVIPNNVVNVVTIDGSLRRISWPSDGGVRRDLLGNVRGVTALAMFVQEGDFNDTLGVIGGLVESLPPSRGGPFGDPNWGQQAGIVSLAAYYGPDKFNHVIVGTGREVQEWYYHPGPIQPPVPPPAVDFSVTPNTGQRDHAYFNVGGSATLQWNVANCDHCVVSMRGFGGFGFSAVILNASKLPTQGTLHVTPGKSADRINTKYVLTASGDTGITTKEVYIDQYVPIGTSDQGQAYCFKLTNLQSFAMPCLTYCVIAKDADTAKKAVEADYGGYTVVAIPQASVTTACQ